jgi:hypothetical protein
MIATLGMRNDQLLECDHSATTTKAMNEISRKMPVAAIVYGKKRGKVPTAN